MIDAKNQLEVNNKMEFEVQVYIQNYDLTDQ